MQLVGLIALAAIVASIAGLVVGGASWPQEFAVYLNLQGAAVESRDPGVCGGAAPYDYIGTGTPVSAVSTSGDVVETVLLGVPVLNEYDGDCSFEAELLSIPGEGDFVLVVGDLPVLNGRSPFTFDLGDWNGVRGVTVGSGRIDGRIETYGNL